MLPNPWDSQYSKTPAPEEPAYYGRRPGQKYPPLVDLLGRTEEGEGGENRQMRLSNRPGRMMTKDDELWS